MNALIARLSVPHFFYWDARAVIVFSRTIQAALINNESYTRASHENARSFRYYLNHHSRHHRNEININLVYVNINSLLDF